MGEVRGEVPTRETGIRNNPEVLKESVRCQTRTVYFARLNSDNRLLHK